MIQCNSVKKIQWMNFILTITTFLIPFYWIRFNLLGIPTNVFEISVAICLFCFLFLFSQGMTWKGNDQKNILHSTFNIQNIFIIACALFLVSCLAGAYLVGFSRDALGILKGWVVAPLVFGAVVRLQVKGYRENVTPLKSNPYSLKPVFVGLYASMLVVSVWAILQKFGIISTLFYQSADSSFAQYLGSNFRAFGPFESPNFLAMFLVPAAILAVGLTSKVKSQKSKVSSWAFYLSFILPLLALIFTQSRAGIIALIGAAVIFSTVSIYRKIKVKKIQVLFIVLAIILYSLFIILVYRFALRPGSDAIRLEIYQNAWIMIKQNWLWGIGLGNFQSVLSGMNLTPSFREVGLSYALHPHNLYMAMWLNFGLLGLLSFLSIATFTIIKLLKNKSVQSLLLLAALSAILIHGVFDTTYFKNDLAAIYWLIVFLAMV